MKKAESLDQKLADLTQKIKSGSGELTGLDIRNLMSDNQLVDRYTDYLTKIFFSHSDPYLKDKYQKYLMSQEGYDPTTFFDRMKLDQKKRKEKAK